MQFIWVFVAVVMLLDLLLVKHGIMLLHIHAVHYIDASLGMEAAVTEGLSCCLLKLLAKRFMDRCWNNRQFLLTSVLSIQSNTLQEICSQNYIWYWDYNYPNINYIWLNTGKLRCELLKSSSCIKKTSL